MEFLGSLLNSDDTIILSVFLVTGLYILLKGGDLLIKGAEALSVSYNIDSFVIGLTVVAFGTSLPEFFVSFIANLSESGDIGIGNVLGSNVCNIALVLGTGAVLAPPIIMRKWTSRIELPIILLISVIFYILMLIGLEISRIDGVILFSMFLSYIYYVYVRAKKNNEDLLDDKDIPKTSRIADIVIIIAGIIGLYLGSDLTIRGASGLARAIGVSELVIGLTIVSIGTSLPELVATIQAIRTNNHNIGVANIIGSNVFNLLFVIGSSSMVKSFSVHPDNIYYWGPAMLFITFIIWPMGYKTNKISRASGIVLLSFYVVYLLLSFSLGSQ